MEKGVDFMKTIFKNEETIEHQFDAFCKKVLRNEARDIYGEIKRWNEKFISIAELTESQMENLQTYDSYETEHINFCTHGYTISIEDELLAKAVAHLPAKQRDVILLTFFLDRNDGEVAAIMGIAQSTLHYHKTKAFESLRLFLVFLEEEVVK